MSRMLRFTATNGVYEKDERTAIPIVDYIKSIRTIPEGTLTSVGESRRAKTQIVTDDKTYYAIEEFDTIVMLCE